NGYIVTNKHVAEESDRLTVSFNNGYFLRAELVGLAQTVDVAVLKAPVHLVPGVKAIPIGASRNHRIGDPVIVIGNPLGLSHSVSSGILSSAPRVIYYYDQIDYNVLVQIDAPMNPGNSGGALL